MCSQYKPEQFSDSEDDQAPAITTLSTDREKAAAYDCILIVGLIQKHRYELQKSADELLEKVKAGPVLTLLDGVVDKVVECLIAYEEKLTTITTKVHQLLSSEPKSKRAVPVHVPAAVPAAVPAIGEKVVVVTQVSKKRKQVPVSQPSDEDEEEQVLISPEEQAKLDAKKEKRRLARQEKAEKKKREESAPASSKQIPSPSKPPNKLERSNAHISSVVENVEFKPVR